MASTVQKISEMLQNILDGEYIDSDQMEKFIKLLERHTGVSTSIYIFNTLHQTL